MDQKKESGPFPANPGQQRPAACHILDLPDDILYLIFRFCDATTLCKLCRVCKTFLKLTSGDHVWLLHSRQFSVLKINNEKKISTKDKCRLAKNRHKGVFLEYPLIKYRVKQLPWLVYSKEELWISDLHCIKCYQQQGNGHLQEKPKCLRGLQDDVSKFVVRDSKVVSGCRDGSVFVWDSYTGRVITEFQQLHQYDAQAVDIHDNVLVSGSRDHTVQITSMSEKKVKTIHNLDDRVWSVTIDPTGRHFACGTAFCFSRAPILLFDLQKDTAIGYLGEDLKYGSGMLDMKYESPHTLLTCGYDTCLRLWDTRTNECVKKWEEPFDTAIDCVQSDDDFTMFAGTSRHGMVRVWDKRQTQPVQMYYTGRKRNSPVYSIAFNHEKLFCALDIGVQVLDFNTQHKRLHYSGT